MISETNLYEPHHKVRLRVDLYEANDRVYFGEMTFYPDSGFDTDILPSTDMDFGSRLVL